MTIDRAIEVLKFLTEGSRVLPNKQGAFKEALADSMEAIKLGIESLARVRLERALGTYEMDYKLQGETEAVPLSQMGSEFLTAYRIAVAAGKILELRKKLGDDLDYKC